jgi:hypothetical protein
MQRACLKASRNFSQKSRLEKREQRRRGAGAGLRSQMRKAPTHSQQLSVSKISSLESSNVLGSGEAQLTRITNCRNTDAFWHPHASRCIQTFFRAATHADYCCAFGLLSEHRRTLNSDMRRLCVNTIARSLQPCIRSTRREEMVRKNEMKLWCSGSVSEQPAQHRGDEDSAAGKRATCVAQSAGDDAHETSAFTAAVR